MVYWLYTQTNTVSFTPKKYKPQEYMIQISTTNYDDLGNIKDSLSADYWEFNPALGCSDLSKPHVVVYKPNGDIWHITANKALAWHPKINDKITKIDMQNGVVIERVEDKQTTPIKIETLALQYTPATKMVTSTEFVSMKQPGIMISGYGMLGDIGNNWVELHDKITTIYTPR